MICGINLIPRHRILAARRQLRLQQWVSVSLVYCVVVVVVVVAAGLMRSLGQDDVELHDQLTMLDEQDKRMAEEVEQGQIQLQETKLVLAANQAVSRPPDWSPLMTLLADIQGDDIVMSNWTLQPLDRDTDRARPATLDPAAADERPDQSGQYRLDLKGFGRTQGDVSHFVLRLEQVPLFDSVSVLQIRRETFMSGRAVKFEVACMIGGPEQEQILP